MSQSDPRDHWIEIGLHGDEKHFVRVADINRVRKDFNGAAVWLVNGERIAIPLEAYGTLLAIISNSNKHAKFDDGVLFRIWVQQAERNPGRVAAALSCCLTAEDYRTAIASLLRN